MYSVKTESLDTTSVVEILFYCCREILQPVSELN